MNRRNWLETILGYPLLGLIVSYFCGSVAVTPSKDETDSQDRSLVTLRVLTKGNLYWEGEATLNEKGGVYEIQAEPLVLTECETEDGSFVAWKDRTVGVQWFDPKDKPEPI